MDLNHLLVVSYSLLIFFLRYICFFMLELDHTDLVHSKHFSHFTSSCTDNNKHILGGIS